MSEAVEKILSFFQRRRTAFQLVFSKTSPASQQVMAELMERCYVNRPFPPDADAIKLARCEGMRDVWLFIQRSINLTPEEQFQLAQQKDKP